MRIRAHSAFGLLAAAAILQAVVLWRRSIPRIPEGPTLGDTLPALRTYAVPSDELIQLGNGASEVDSCTVVVAISTTCGVCALMRDQWNEKYSHWLDTVGAPVRAVWVAAAESDTLQAFLDGSGLLDAVGLARMRPGDPDFRTRLGVYATPTVYLLDQHDKLRIGSLGFNLPPVDSAAQICRTPL
jgi:hypothetical protein